MDTQEIQTGITQTPLSKELLLSEGFIYKFDELIAQGVDLESPDAPEDPYYFYKGDFRIYDVIEDFYYNGGKVTTLEEIKALYEAETNRIYVPTVVLEDTAPVSVLHTGKVDKSRFVKAKLTGGPGEGITVKWPRGLAFFVYQVKNDNGKTESFRYRRKAGTKTKFLYAGPLQ